MFCLPFENGVNSKVNKFFLFNVDPFSERTLRTGKHSGRHKSCKKMVENVPCVFRPLNSQSNEPVHDKTYNKTCVTSKDSVSLYILPAWQELVHPSSSLLTHLIVGFVVHWLKWYFEIQCTGCLIIMIFIIILFCYQAISPQKHTLWVLIRSASLRHF